MVLQNAYHWQNLALGQSPNLSRYRDVDIRDRLRANPVGVLTDTRKGGLYLPLLGTVLQPASWAPLIGDGQLITYQLDTANVGLAAAPDEHLILKITSRGSLVLPGGQQITLPDGT